MSEVTMNPIEELEKEGKLREEEKYYHYKLLDGAEVLIRKRITFGEMQAMEGELVKGRSVDQNGNVSAALDNAENFLRKKILTYANTISKEGVLSPMTREILDNMDAEEIVDINNVLDVHYDRLKKKQEKTTAR